MSGPSTVRECRIGSVGGRSAVTRLLNRYGPPLAGLRGGDLVAAVKSAEGRSLLAEVLAAAPPLLAGTSNAELVAFVGADLVCLNLVDPSA